MRLEVNAKQTRVSVCMTVTWQEQGIPGEETLPVLAEACGPGAVGRPRVLLCPAEGAQPPTPSRAGPGSGRSRDEAVRDQLVPYSLIPAPPASWTRPARCRGLCALCWAEQHTRPPHRARPASFCQHREGFFPGDALFLPGDGHAHRDSCLFGINFKSHLGRNKEELM